MEGVEEMKEEEDKMEESVDSKKMVKENVGLDGGC